MDSLVVMLVANAHNDTSVTKGTMSKAEILNRMDLLVAINASSALSPGPIQRIAYPAPRGRLDRAEYSRNSELLASIMV